MVTRLSSNRAQRRSTSSLCHHQLKQLTITFKSHADKVLSASENSLFKLREQEFGKDMVKI